jgi:transcriptional regulator with XRE-family HTH domain
VYAGGVSIPKHSQIANVFASGENRRNGNDQNGCISHYANMDESEDKNGGPNHLRAWMTYRKMKGAALAEALGGNVTPGMVSDLVNSNRALSAKWLRRIAPVLKTTPGMLLDHDPHDLPSDILEIWVNADPTQRRQLAEVAKALVRDGTNG